MPVVIRPQLPEMLTAPTTEPEWAGTSNMELVEYILELRDALGRCNADKAAIATSSFTNQ